MSTANIARLHAETLRGDRAAARELLDHARRHDDPELELIARTGLPEVGGWARILNLVGKGHGEVEVLDAAFDAHWPDHARPITERELAQLAPDREPPRWLPLVRGLRRKLSVEQLGHALAHETLVRQLRHIEVEADSWVYRGGQHSEYDPRLDTGFSHLLSRALTTARPTTFNLTMRPELSRTFLNVPGGRALLQALGDSPLRHVELRTPLGDDDLQRIAEAPWLGALTTLALVESRPGRRREAVCAALPAVLEGLGTGLRTLRLGGLRVQALGDTLAALPSLTGLEHLEVCGCELGDAGAAVLAGAPHLGALHTLEVRDNGLTHVGAQALLGATSQLQLVRLDLRHNAIASLDPDAFAERALTRLRHLDVRDNPLDEASLTALRTWRDAMTGTDLPRRVQHARFGPGTVVAVRDAIVEVAFDDGITRKLHERFLHPASEGASPASDELELLVSSPRRPA